MAKVYIKIDSQSQTITEINSSVFIDDTSDWIEIDEGHGDAFAHAQNNYLRGPLFTEEGDPRYAYDNGEIIPLDPNEENPYSDLLINLKPHP